VPYSGCMIPTGSDNAATVGRKGRVLNLVRVATQREQQTTSGIPYFGGVIMAGAEHPLAIGREPYHFNRAFMPEDPQRFRKGSGSREVGFFRFGCTPAADS